MIEKLKPRIPVISLEDAERFWRKTIDLEPTEFYTQEDLQKAFSRRRQKADAKIIFHQGFSLQEIILDLEKIDWTVDLIAEDGVWLDAVALLLEEEIDPGYYLVQTEDIWERQDSKQVYSESSPALALESILLSEFMHREKYIPPFPDYFLGRFSKNSYWLHACPWKNWTVSMSPPDWDKKKIKLAIWKKESFLCEFNQRLICALKPKSTAIIKLAEKIFV